MEKTKNKKKLNILVICMGIVLCALLITGITQTFILKAKQNNLANVKQENQNYQQEYEDIKQEYEYKGQVDENGNPIINDKFYEDYWKSQEDKNYGNEGDKIIEIN